MRAVSIKNPYAWLISEGIKTVEARTWKISPGPILICSSSKSSTLVKGHDGILRPASMPNGVMLCVADVIDCRPMKPSDAEAACFPFNPLLYSWVLSNIRPVSQNLVKGQLRVFEIPDALVQYIEVHEAPM